MRIKIFSNKYIEDTEEEVNNWLSLNDPTVISITISDGGLTMCVLYAKYSEEVKP